MGDKKLPRRERERLRRRDEMLAAALKLFSEKGEVFYGHVNPFQNNQFFSRCFFLNLILYPEYNKPI